MSEAAVSDRVFTIPNLISFVRLAAIPWFWWLVLGAEDIGLGTLVFVIVATTDWIDGFLARRLGQVSRLGKSLDPVADRLMIASGLIVGLISGIVPAAIVWPLIAREAYMAVVTVILVVRGKGTLTVRPLGKLATFIVYSSIGWFYIAAVPLLEDLLGALAWAAGLVGLALYWWVAVLYTGDARRVLSGLESAAISEESHEHT